MFYSLATKPRARPATPSSGGYVDLDDERFDIRAKVISIGGYSAHADQNGLVEFVTGMRECPREARVVHAEAEAKQALATFLRAKYHLKKDKF